MVPPSCFGLATVEPDKAALSRVGGACLFVIESHALVLADAFIKYSVDNGKAPFKVAWYLSDNTVTISYLQSNTVDVGITYNEAAEDIAIQQGIAKSPKYYAFHDHFLLVGPPINPANLSMSDDILTMFSDLFAGAQNTSNPTPVRFLSRYDKSATNIKESSLWIGIGQVREYGGLLILRARFRGLQPTQHGITNTSLFPSKHSRQLFFSWNIPSPIEAHIYLYLQNTRTKPSYTRPVRIMKATLSSIRHICSSEPRLQIWMSPIASQPGSQAVTARM
jgi:hypothetical protein